MKFTALLLLLAIAATAETQNVGPHTRMATHPFRKVGEKTWDLRNLFQYWERPLPGQIRPPALTAWREHGFRVLQVFQGGLLVTEGKDPRRYLLRNHPLESKVVDGDFIETLCVKLEDRFQYKTVEGSVSTVDQYDYGIPVDPADFAKQNAGK